MPLVAAEILPAMNGLMNGAPTSGNESLADEPQGGEDEPGNQAGEELELPEPMKPVEVMNGLDYAEVPYVETLPPQPLHVAHIIPQPMGQPYLYPGQYMFGHPMAGVNG
jgi:hypothetical protein